MTDYTPIVIVLLFAVVAFTSASRNGVVNILSSGIAATCAMVVFFGLFTWLIQSDARALAWKTQAGVSFGAAVLAYALALWAGKQLLRQMFNTEGFLHWAVDGTMGGLLALTTVPVVAFFVFTCVRVAGTVQELNYVDSLAQPEAETLTQFPAYPFSANWRNGIESIPLVAPLLDAVDPFNHRVNRHAAAVLLSQPSAMFSQHLARHPETSSAVGLPALEELRQHEGIGRAVRSHERFGLVLHPEVRRVTRDGDARDVLNRTRWRNAILTHVDHLKARFQQAVPDDEDS